jgi:hypothetical protein
MAAIKPQRVRKDAPTNGGVADVKSQRAGTPTLVSRDGVRERVVANGGQ